MITERQTHRTGEVLDRADLFEDLSQAGDLRDLGGAAGERRGHTGLPEVIAEQPVKAGGLQGQEIRCGQGLADLGEGCPVESGGKGRDVR